MSAGHCFRAGHASSTLWIASIVVLRLLERPARAYTIFVVSLIPGLTLGLAQRARGAHFPTHTLWTVWSTVLIVVVLSRGVVGQKRAGGRGNAIAKRCRLE